MRSFSGGSYHTRLHVAHMVYVGQGYIAFNDQEYELWMRKWVIYYGFSKGLLSMSGSIGRHSYIAQVYFESSHGVFLLWLCTMNMHYVYVLWICITLGTMNMHYVYVFWILIMFMYHEYAMCYVLWICIMFM